MPLRKMLLTLAACFALAPPLFGQSKAGPFTLNAANQCATIAATGMATVGIQVTGTFSATLQPEVSIQGQAPQNRQATPSTSSTAQSTITAAGAYTSAVGGYDTFLLCVSSYSSGTATVYLNATPATNASLFGTGVGGGSVTSVGLAGTTNQITVTGASPITGSGSWTLSLPSTLVLPNGTTATTQTVGDNSTDVATDAFVLANSFVNPMTTLGSTLVEGAGPAPAELLGPTTPNGIAQVMTSTPSGGLATAQAWKLPGVPGRAITGTTATDTIATTDCAPNRIEYVGSVAVAVTLPTATTLAVPNCVFRLANNTTGTNTAVTVTPTTWTCNGSATCVIAKGQIATVYVDPNSASNWVADVTEEGLTAGSGIGFTRAATGLTIATTGAPPTGTAGGALSGSYPNPGLATKYATTNCQIDSDGSGAGGVIVSTDARSLECINKKGGTVTITGVFCVALGGTAATVAIANSASTTVNTAQAVGLTLTSLTLTGTPTLTDGQWLNTTLVGDSATTNLHCVVVGTY